MAFGTIATWRMAFDGVNDAFDMLKAGESSGDAIVKLIKNVEDYPYYKSVGYGGLPNLDGELEMDAAYMDGSTLQVGAIAAIKDYESPVEIAKHLSQHKVNTLLVGEGANKYAEKFGFKRKKMLTDRAKKIWQKRRKEIKEWNEVKAYDGHDTVGAICLDKNEDMVAATSTSGLFMKRPGRVGDSPLCGSGFYADSNVGAATATGLGEDLMKGVLSYEIVRKIGEGMHPQEACDKAVYQFAEKLKNRLNYKDEDLQLSLIAMDKNGNWGAATTVEFTFCVATDKQEPQIFISWPEKNMKTKIEKISDEWLDEYDKKIHKPID